MNTRVHSQTKLSSTSLFTPAPINLVQRKCACGGSAGLSGECDSCQKEKLVGDSAPLRQPKLKVSQPNDKYEQEADRVADEVMRMPEPKVQRQVGVEEAEETKGLVQPKTNSTIATSILSVPNHFLNHLGSGQLLDARTRSFFEPRLGYDLSHVRVHADTCAAESTRTIQARAYTIGHNVVFGDGQYTPHTSHGQRLLAHELTHVIQQQNKNNDSNVDIRRAAQGMLAVAGLDITELENPVSLPGFLKAGRFALSPTRVLVIAINPDWVKTSSADIQNPWLLADQGGSSIRIGFEYILTVSPDLASGGKHWLHDEVKVGGQIPALKPHEETHFRLMQLAYQTQFERDLRTKNVKKLVDADQLVSDVIKDATPTLSFVNAKFDVKTTHGQDFRPEKRWERETKHQKEIRRADRLRKRNFKRFNRRLSNLEATSMRILHIDSNGKQSEGESPGRMGRAKRNPLMNGRDTRM